VIPGRFFGNNGIGHIRMTFVSETEERIKLGIEKINQFLNAKELI
jgi:aspartate aminotransferase